jgi:hypothetical protein
MIQKEVITELKTMEIEIKKKIEVMENINSIQ